MPNISLRPVARPPAQEHERTSPGCTNTRTLTTFKHPAYSDDFQQGSLLQLYTWDTRDGGLHAGTALLACAIVACNAQDGYLTRNRDGGSLHVGDDEVLLDDEYYYHVPNPLPATQESSGRAYYKHPVYPTFEHWPFPHGIIPARWLGGVEGREGGEGGEGGETIDPSSTPSVSSVSVAVIARDRACAISKYRDYIERAHLCPRNELDWFQQTERMYHHQPVEIAASVSAEFLLARFAWAIFPLVKAFIEQGPERLVKLQGKSSDGFYEVTKTLDPADFAQLGTTRRGRAKSPKKRKALDLNLPSVVEAKRPCLSTDGSDNCEEVPSLFCQSAISEEEPDEDMVATIRKQQLRKRRPTHDPSLICCDYSLAERENAMGHPGKPE
ncbi:hypothetical protein BJ875DRAFT_509286 [Amylocarpus encephaloides]|uniref:HNH nuclease domain-containing protein n=1 Tax=Amylocarpus encephaloides TaxID=45428 RepID=A0A9P7YJY5_9HELO|nr:hypothetical protein BJ875DRAFT_509286 [Amylocarpus encephaloides]